MCVLLPMVHWIIFVACFLGLSDAHECLDGLQMALVTWTSTHLAGNHHTAG